MSGAARAAWLATLALASGCGDPARLTGAPLEQGVVFGAPDCAARSGLALLTRATVDFGEGAVTVDPLLCSAVLVAPDAALTAAHCVDLTAQGAVSVTDVERAVTRVADLSAVFNGGAPWPAARVAVEEVVAHPQFDADGFASLTGLGDANDLALLLLATPVDAPVARVARAAPSLGLGVDVEGWGTDRGDAGFADDRAAVQRCAFSFVNEVSTGEVQIGSSAASVRRCFGDSGGATYLPDADPPVVVAVGSRSYGDACLEGGVDTRLDIHATWLDDELRAACARGARDACEPPGLLPEPVDAGDEDAGDGDAGGADDAGDSADGGARRDGGERGDGGPPPTPPSCGGCTQASGAPHGALLALLVYFRRRRSAKATASKASAPTGAA